MSENKKRIVITGANGLLGWHAHVRLFAANRSAAYLGRTEPYDIIALGHREFLDDRLLCSSIKNSDAVLHFAGVNRAPDSELELANPAIAKRLVTACTKVGANPHIVFANSIHASADTPYGRSKKRAGETLAEYTKSYTDLKFPHIFGECARPYYNSVTATLIKQILDESEVSINPEGEVNLLHAGEAAQHAINVVSGGSNESLSSKCTPMQVCRLYDTLTRFHLDYHRANLYPEFSSAFELALFNSYRAATYPGEWPRQLALHKDLRGQLFEAYKGGGGGQAFLSTTAPGVTRGDHFHLRKVERFLVLKGEAVIRLRKVLADEIWEYRVSGETPVSVDMPTMHSHSIQNVGQSELLTLFWSHELFDPEDTDTYADKVKVL